MKVKYENATRKSRSTMRKQSDSGSDISDKTVLSQQAPKSTCSSTCQARRFRLPKIELRKFDGNVKNWIGFWGQFKKIDSDETMDDDDKFQYLFQCTVPESPARELIESFPPSGENYRTAIEQLKSRFARDDLLIEVYVRELLSLVLAQAKGKTTHNLGHLYDKLNTQLQALQSLGVTIDKYAALLFPLVESALPESVLRAWERSQTQVEKTDEHLKQLMQFLKREVESEERIQLARSGLASGDYANNCAPTQPTAACLVSTESEGKRTCIWCDKDTHGSLECYKANKMTYENRRDYLTKKGACLIRMKAGHSARKCKNFSLKCLCCSKRHSILLCPDLKSSNSKQKSVKAETSSTVNNVSHNKSTTLLQTLMVKITNNNKCATIRAFIDTGSQRSYIRRDIIEDLNIKPVSTETLSHCLFGGIETNCQQYRCYEFGVKSVDDSFKLNMTVLDKSTICGYIPRVSNTHSIMSQLQKHNVILSDVGDEATPDIGLLIGADYAGLLLTESFLQLEGNLMAMKTKFGWTLQGTTTNTCSVTANVVLANLQLSELWDLETLGIRDPSETTSKAKIDAIIQEEFRNAIKINSEGRYEVALPWKPGHGQLLNNRHLAEKRLLSTTQKLEKLNEFHSYGQVFEEWEKLGIIEKVDDSFPKPKHYLSHHAVIKESSLTTRVSPVFDASAKDYNGNSLNFFLEKGVNCLELIPTLLIKFRKHAIGITSDIKKAFLQLSVKEEDRQYLSFLWWKDYERKEFMSYRHCRVVFGLSSSPFLLGATINYHLEKYTEECKDSAERLQNSFYVDNCVTSIETEHEARVFIEQAMEIMRNGQFELRGWITSPIPNEEMTGEEETQTVLGLIWNLKSDELYCNVNFVNDIKERVTKRELLSITQKIFDPIGVVCPVTLIPKLILQKTWEPKLSWDKELPDNLQNEYHGWLKHINSLNDCRIPRRLTTNSIEKCNNSLHVFSDASKASFAAVIFLRSEKNGNVTVQLIQAKSRVAPVREVTIPRLELMATLIATRLCVQVKKALELSNCKDYFWTDSSVALTWITTNGNWDIFVKNRVTEIRKYTDLNDWHYLPGSKNPADLPSRGCNAKYLLDSKWWEGPEWLYANEVEWPKSEFKINEEELILEKKRMVNVNNITDVASFLSKLTYFSKYAMMVRMFGWIKRFLHNCQNVNDKHTGELSCEEYQNAEKKIPQMVQTEAMINTRKKKKDLHLFKDNEGIIRVRTKLLLSAEPADFVCPIYLPGNHLIIQRLVEAKHRLFSHAGSSTLMSELRESYWITGVRKLIKSQSTKSLSTKAFLMALRRFVDRRGRVETIYTDNGTNFHGANNELKALNWDEITAYSGVRKIKWIFNPPAAPWWGGWWERLVRSIKELLRRNLGKKTVDYEELQTVLCDCEAVINSRPITYVADSTEHLKPITPACFLHELPNSNVPDLDQIDRDSLDRRLNYLQKLRDGLRERFRKEYLSMLVQKGKERDVRLNVGDVVLLNNGDKRIKWPLGIITEIYRGRYGNARVARVRTNDGEYTRAYQRLYPLEVQ